MIAGVSAHNDWEVRWKMECRRMKQARERYTRFESLESRIVLSVDLVISEVLASNDEVLLDYGDDSSDFLEIHNRGSSRIDLKGWHLTDDLANTTKWQVPVSTVLEPDERLVVFVSNKDFVALNGELHTNFQFNSVGEAIGLADPGGQLVDSFAFAAQARDVSFGIDESGFEITSLVTPGAAARALVPSDNSLGMTWTGGNEPFNDAAWTSGTTGVGYETVQVGPAIAVPVAYWTFDELLFGGTIAPDAEGRYDAVVSGATVTTGGQGMFGESLSFDGDDDYVLPGVISELVSPAAFSLSMWFRRTVDHAGAVNETNHFVNNVLIAQSSSADNDNLEIGSEGDAVEVYLDTTELGGRIPPVSQPASIQNDTWHHLVVSYDSGQANELKLYVDGALASEHSEYGGLIASSGISPFTIGLSRPDGSALGGFEGLIDDVAVWDAALDSQQVSALAGGTSPLLLSGFAPQLGLDLETEISGPTDNPSAYIRIPFTVTDPGAVDMLCLRMKYDDGFVAYVNGQEVARSNVIGQPQWNSTADSDRADTLALAFEEFSISVAAQPGLVHSGDNMLAIQLLTDAADSDRALVLPELDVVQLPDRDVVILETGVAATALVPTSGSLGSTWTGGNEPFNDAAWTIGTTGAGYDTGPGGPVRGPIAYWTFDTLADGGTTAPDATGNYDGAVTGATLTSGGQGQFGEALVLDGDNDSVSAGVIGELVSPSAFTISVWFRRTVDHAGTNSETNHFVNNVLIAQSSNLANDNLEIGTEGGAVEVYLDTADLGGGILPISEPASVQNDTWHHLAVTYDSGASNELKLHVDGALVSEHNEYGGLVSDSGVSPFSIGLARPGQDEWGDFEGLIDDVAIWDVALGTTQIAALFAGTSPLQFFAYTDLIGMDLATQMAAQNSSAYVRVPFAIDDPDAVLSFNLDVKYDDAFVAYINGTEVARTGFAGAPVWNSAADAERPDLASFDSERFVIANQAGLLQAGVNLLAIQSLNVTSDAVRLLILPELSATMLPGTLLSYMEMPTPGAANAEGFVGFVAPPLFSVGGGTFFDPLALELAGITPDTQIRYTIDRSVPTESSLLYTGPIAISETTQVRALAFRPGYVTSEVVSETYVATASDVLNVSSDLPIIVLENFGQGAPLGTMQSEKPFLDSFLAVYEPDGTGRSRLTNPAVLTSRLGMHPRGNSTLTNPKTNWRIETRDESDKDRNVELLALPAESDFILYGPYTFDRSMIRDTLIHELSRQLGRYAPRTRFVEVYANIDGDDLAQSDYTGVYVLEERIQRDVNRVDVAKLSSQYDSEPLITGGYILKRDTGTGAINTGQGNIFVLVDPDLDEVTNTQLNYIRRFFDDLEAALYGPNFTDPQLGFRQYLDVGAAVDHSLLVNLSKDPDGFGTSTFLFKDQNDKLNFGPTWDFDTALGQDRPEPFYEPEGFGDRLELNWWPRLYQDPDFEQDWIDRWQELRETVFSVDNMNAIIDGMAAELDEAQVRNFARWPETAPDGGVYAEPGLVGYEGEVSHLKGWISTRMIWIDGQTVTPASFDVEPGFVDPGFEITLSAPEGRLYYTLDGSDPRLSGGAVSPQAVEYTGQPIVINNSTKIFARVFGDGLSASRRFASNRWSSPTVGDFVTPSGLVVSEIQYNPHAADPGQGETDMVTDNYEFIELSNTGSASIDLGGMQFVQLDVNGDLQGVDFTFASQTLNPGEQVVVVKNRSAFESRYGTGVAIANGNDGLGGNNGEFAGQLSNGGERITLINNSGISLLSFDYDDQGLWPERADGGGSSLELVDPFINPDGPANWRNSVEYGGSPGAAGIGNANSVVINEVLTNTPGPVNDTVEFFNPTGNPIDIGGMWLSDNLGNLDRYVIPAGNVVPAGGYLVLDENQFDFGLNGDEGEVVVLVDPSQNPTWFIDHVSFGAALAGESFGRWPDSSGILYPMISGTLGAANSGPRIGPLVINEVMYNPPAPAAGNVFDPQFLEFIEIYNPTATSVELTGWVLDGIGFEFASGTTIGAGQLLVVVPFDPTVDGAKIADFENVYDVNIAANLPNCLGPYPGRLDNGGELLTLRRAVPPGGSGSPLVVEDQVGYVDVAPWPVAADGQGHSLQRNLTDLWGRDPSVWTGAAPSPGNIGPRHHFELADVTHVIGEVGQAASVTHEGQVIQLNHSFDNPVVLAGPASFVGGDPVVVRVTNVQSDQFTLFVAEPPDENGLHNAAETVSYLVMEAGLHALDDGTLLEVGTVTTNKQVGPLVIDGWTSVNFSQPFSTRPSVFHEIQTTNGNPYLQTRIRSTTSSSVDVTLQQAQSQTATPAVETVGYLAMEPGFGTWSGMAYDTLTAFGASNNFSTLNFGRTFSTPPNLIASLARVGDVDNAHLRFSNLGVAGVDLKVEEDTTFDTETFHNAEFVALLALEGTGLLTTSGVSAIDGQTQTYMVDVTSTGRISDVNVKLTLSHPLAGELAVTLVGPDGTRVELFAALGGSSGDLSGTTFDGEAPQSITSGSDPFSGRFRPTGNLSDLNGHAAEGTWTLEIIDTVANGMAGTLLEWTLDIALQPQPLGNLNNDSHLDARDIDLLYANLGSSLVTFDLDIDGDADREDVRHLVENIMGRRFGDADLDGDVDLVDSDAVTANFDPLGQNALSGWSTGDFDGDRDVDITDALRIMLNFAPLGYTPPGASIQAATDAAISDADRWRPNRFRGLFRPTGTEDGDVADRKTPSPLTVSTAGEQRAQSRAVTPRYHSGDSVNSGDPSLLVGNYFGTRRRSRLENGSE